MTNRSIPRSEHPRPDFMRDTYQTLNGEWQFAYDDENIGLEENWVDEAHVLPMSILVPFSYQAKMSGIGTDEIHPIIWYRRSFTIPEEMSGKRILLRFGAVDWECSVYVNGKRVGGHTGGYTPFALDITHALREGENDLCLRVVDEADCTQPRGKQYWDRGVMGCWYTPNSGIWQSVYLEAVGNVYLQRVHVRPDIERHQAIVSMTLDHIPQNELKLELTLSFKDRLSRTYTVTAKEKEIRFPMDVQMDGTINGIICWSPENPNLLDLSVKVFEGETLMDHVRTYFGMRKVELKDSYVLLNERPFYQRLILDQGYWPDSLLTPPSDEAIRADVEWTKKFGYNGARKHQKIEDPRYYYWADKLGLVVWGEVPSAYVFNHDSVDGLSQTLTAFIDRDYNHPSIITWVPLNESWGVNRILNDKNQQALGRMLYHQAKALDGTRLVSANDGWEQTTTDISALHDYTAWGDDLAIHFASREQVDQIGCDERMAWADTETPTGKEAFMVTEYGGIAFDSIGEQDDIGGMATWGYNGKVQTQEAFVERFKSAVDAIRSIPFCRGYCYTQLTDVMQEINGLLTPDRKPKVEAAKLAEINRNPKSR